MPLIVMPQLNVIRWFKPWGFAPVRGDAVKYEDEDEEKNVC